MTRAFVLFVSGRSLLGWGLLGCGFLLGCGGAAPAAGAAEPAAPTSPTDTTSPAPVAEPPTSVPPRSAAPSAASNPSPEREDPTPAAPLPLPEGTRVLHIGDSMAGALGIELNRQFEEHGIDGKLRYETASFIPTWAWSKKLPVYLAQHDPQLVVISLGTNELEIDKPEQRAKTIQRLVGRLEGRPCVWVAPPKLEADNGLRNVIRSNCAPCGYMDTNEVYADMPRVSDKVHPTMNARREWARRVIEWLQVHRAPSDEQPWALDLEVVPPAPEPLEK